MHYDIFEKGIRKLVNLVPGFVCTDENIKAWYDATACFDPADIINALDDIAISEASLSGRYSNIAAMIATRCRRTMSPDYIESQLMNCTSYDDLTHISPGLRTMAYNNALLDDAMTSERRRFLSRDICKWFLADEKGDGKKKRGGDKFGSGLPADFPMPIILLENGDRVPVNEWEQYSSTRPLPAPETIEELKQTSDALDGVIRGCAGSDMGLFESALSEVFRKMGAM